MQGKSWMQNNGQLTARKMSVDRSIADLNHKIRDLIQNNCTCLLRIGDGMNHHFN